MRRVYSVGILAAALGVAGCETNNPVAATEVVGRLVIQAAGLEQLGPGYAYEGWIIVNGAPISTGTFTVGATGTPSQTIFNVDNDSLDAATKFVLTIEPSPDPDPGPSATKYLAGDFAGISATATVMDGAAFGTSFASAAGSFILATPTTAAIATDHANGIWWLDPTAGPGPSLTLPALPAGWAYEGWVVGPGGPISTGRFLTPVGADSDGAGPTSGPDGFPPFPGQDFITPPMSLIGYAAVISIEPEPDDSAGPFTLKPLVDGSIDDVGMGVPQGMANMTGGLPTLTVSR